MSAKRIVPDITSEDTEASREFYSGFLGMDLAMDMGWIQTYVSPGNPTAQVTILMPTQSEIPNPDLSIEVGEIDALYAKAVESGQEIIYPLTDEPWGVRRFFVVDPDGTVINVMSHLPSDPSS